MHVKHYQGDLSHLRRKIIRKCHEKPSSISKMHENPPAAESYPRTVRGSSAYIQCCQAVSGMGREEALEFVAVTSCSIRSIDRRHPCKQYTLSFQPLNSTVTWKSGMLPLFVVVAKVVCPRRLQLISGYSAVYKQIPVWSLHEIADFALILRNDLAIELTASIPLTRMQRPWTTRSHTFASVHQAVKIIGAWQVM